LADFCLKLAFNEKEPKEFQAVARKSAANVVAETNPTILKALVHFGRPSPSMLDFMADLYEGERMRKAFSGLQRWFTVRRIAQRRRRTYAALRPNFINRGIRGGICGGVCCMLPAILEVIAIAPILDSEYWTREMFSSSVSNFSERALIIGGVPIIIGGMIGWRNGATAFNACVMGITRWKTAAEPSVLIDSAPTEETTGAKIVRLVVKVYSVLILIYFAWWPFLRVALAPVVGFTEAVIRKQRTRGSRILRSAIIFLAPAFALATLPILVQHDFSEAALWILGIFVVLLCLLHIDICCFSYAFPDGGIGGAQPLDRPPKRDACQR
jgi:hypothetical protein